jgi:RNA polymerase sigma factor (sigma-70 family)
MSEDAGSVTLMIHQLRSDDPALRDEAARRIWDHYFRELLELARRHLSGRVRARVDEEDVLQSVYQSVCRRQQQGAFDLSGRDDFWKLLVTITLRKARSAARWHTREKRDVRREEGVGPSDDELEALAARQPALGPTPEEAAAFAEAFRRRLELLPDPALRDIALRKLEGHGNREIALQLGCTERTVERKLNLIRRFWELDAGDEPG